MWEKIAAFAIRQRWPILAGVVALVAFMGWQARKAEMSYDFAKIVPPDDPEMVYFQQFLRTFGEDANLFVVGLKDSSLYRYDVFKQYAGLAQAVADLPGVTEVISLPTLRYIAKDTAARRFVFAPLMEPFPANQRQLDSLLAEASKIKLYEGQLINPVNGATMLAVAIRKDIINSPARAGLVLKVIELGQQFTQATGVKTHFAGLPYVRTVVARNLRQELNLFLSLSLGVTVVVLYLFFRAFSPSVVSVVLIGVVVVCTLGTLGIFGYKITMLTGLLPPILVVIGIPNCVYFITKYHQEFLRQGDKVKALVAVSRKIGAVTLITNLTTAVGFLVLLTMDISILREFGLVAGLNIIITFLLSLLLLPIAFSLLPNPTPRHTRHLERVRMKGLLDFIDHLVAERRPWVYLVSLGLAAASVVGLLRIRSVSFMVDDLPQNSAVMQDLRFFETHFKGVMPLEIVVDTGKKRVLRDLKRLRRIDAFEQHLRSLPHLTPPVSVLSFLKAANQALGNVRVEETYALPTQTGELVTIERYTRQQTDSLGLVNSFMDSTGQQVRISLKVADLGSVRMDTLVKNQIATAADSLLGADMKTHITGTTLLFIKGNSYLITNMKQSLALAIVLIGGIIGVMFRNLRITVITIVANLLPILVTAGLMGFAGVPLKPSTVLVFSIVFGIAVDDAIHFLARYRASLRQHEFNVAEAVHYTLAETGIGMVYTSVVLFAGFIIFTGSNFESTVALGAITATTLLVAMVTNLVLLPCLLRNFSQGRADTATDEDLVVDEGSDDEALTEPA
ncbi:MAG: MMPL family transporter [Bernardetiaceae bacterium]|jgi:hypothetical protein|nr:MMPL family transporter [Bernardetiaceae bacterium]